ncbi:cell division protein FtsA, partial [bacterium]|nr:cell division protein FtsA [bacterium]
MARRQAIHVALDIGTHKTAVLVAAVEDGAPRVLACGSSPTQGLRRGVVVNIDSTVQSIEAAVREAEGMADCEIHS